MLLFKWESECLRRYSQGDIIVMAETTSQARKIAISEGETYLLNMYKELYYCTDADGNLDADDQAEHDERVAVLVQDVAVAPDIVPLGVLFMPGSE